MNHNGIAHSWKVKMDSMLEQAKNNLIFVGAIGGCILLLGGGWYGYHYFSTQKEQAATTILADCLSEYDNATQGKTQWSNVTAMCQAGYEKFSGTKIAPYILAVEVDSLLAEQKKPEALEKIDLMISKIGSNSPLYPLYILKQALLKLDMPEAAVQEGGLGALERLANDGKNIYRDAAQFYLGLYYQNKGEEQKATQVWNQLVAINENVEDTQAQSPWATLAKNKMNGLS